MPREERIANPAEWGGNPTRPGFCFLFVPAGTVYSAKNVGTGNGAALATYVVEKGKPLITLAPR
jgi:hypothetical protein